MVLYYGVAWCMYVVLIRPQGRKKEALPTKGSFRTRFHYMDRNFTKYDRVNHVYFILPNIQMLIFSPNFVKINYTSIWGGYMPSKTDIESAFGLHAQFC